MIYYSMPFDTGKQIARYYNAFMELLPSDDDFACFIDGDASFTTVYYGRQLAEAVAAYPTCGLFYAVTNRIACPWQIAPSVNRQSNDMAYHRSFGKKLADLHGNQCDLVNHAAPASGFFMLIKKELWRKLNGFRGEGMLKVDNHFYDDCRQAEQPIRLMKGVYLYHWYRFDTKAAAHLLP